MLYAHPSPGETLVPLLRAHLPQSLPSYGCVSFHLSLANPPTTPFAFASFPPDAPPRSDSLWTVIVRQQPPSTPQVRVFSSVESVVEPSQEELVQGEAQLREMLKTYCLSVSDEEVWIGALAEVWIDRIGLAKDHIYGVWLAPEVGEDGEEEVEVPSGYTLRKADKRDIQTVCDTSEVQRPAAYIQSILPFSSALATPDGTAQAWIFSHSDYSLGALFTQPDYRRKGLAHVVVKDRLRGMRQAGVRPWCCIADTNLPSQAFWKQAFGWSKGWDCGWFHIPVEDL